MRGLKWTTAGESHGPGLVGILEGLPAGLELDVAAIDRELVRRQGGYGRGGRMRIESDHVEVLSGLRAGRTLGSPLALLVPNRDSVIDELPIPKSPRPGHADLAGCQRLLRPDPRAVLERASARETAIRVALGAAARQVLDAFGVLVFGHVVEFAGMPAADLKLGAAAQFEPSWFELRAGSEFACLDGGVDATWKAAVDQAKEQGDSLGGVVEVVAFGLPPGLGGYADPRDRLSGRLAGAVMSIPALKGVEIGAGFGAARLPGSEMHDEIVPPKLGEWGWGRFARASNRAGGLEGGMTTGAPLVIRAAMKPISTIRKGLGTVAFGSGEALKSTWQRSDVTAVPAVSVVAEALVALELTAVFLETFGAGSMDQVADRFDRWRGSLEAL